MTVLTDLFEDLRDTQDEIVRQARGQWFGQQRDGGAGNTAWMPVVDIAERKDAYLVMVELPGVGIDDLEIICQDGLMTIQGERSNANDPAEQKVYRAERRYGRFLRSITLPSNVVAEAIEASTRDGVLRIVVPKPKEAHAKRVKVRADQAHATPALGKTGHN